MMSDEAEKSANAVESTDPRPPDPPKVAIEVKEGEGKAEPIAEGKAEPKAEGKAPKEASHTGKKGKRPHARRATASPRLPTGSIVAIDGDMVRVDLGAQGQGVIGVDEFDKAPSPAEVFQFSLIGLEETTEGGVRVWRLSRKEARIQDAWGSIDKGQIVEAQVIGQNSGGLEVSLGLISAFLPASEVDTFRVRDLTPFVGTAVSCEVIEVARRRKRVVVSRKSVLQRERREQRGKVIATLSEGAVVPGRIEKLESFGAFVDLGGGVTGLLHVSNISHQRIKTPAAVLTVGQEVEVLVLELKNRGKRIGLGLKQLQADPWEAVASRVGIGHVVTGKVVRISDFGAFVELEPAVEGLLHKSQISDERIQRVEDFLKVGDDVTVRVQSFDINGRRISLTRLNERGQIIGSDEDISGEETQAYSQAEEASSGTNLGALLRAAIAKKEEKGDR